MHQPLHLAHLSARAWQDRGAFSFGCIVAIANLVDCLPVKALFCLPGVFDEYPRLDTPQERAFGNYGRGRHGWVLENVRALKVPIPATGHQGIWNWEPPTNLEDLYEKRPALG